MTQLYQSLIRSAQPPTALEMKPYLDRLIQMGRFDEANQAWRATSSQADARAVSLQRQFRSSARWVAI